MTTTTKTITMTLADRIERLGRRPIKADALDMQDDLEKVRYEAEELEHAIASLIEAINCWTDDDEEDKAKYFDEVKQYSGQTVQQARWVQGALLGFGPPSDYSMKKMTPAEIVDLFKAALSDQRLAQAFRDTWGLM